MIPKLTHPFLSQDQNGAPLNIQYGFFTRVGGVSTGDFSSLNCKWSREKNIDTQDHILQNREIISKEINHVPIKTVHQVHKNNVIVVKDPTQITEHIEADALVTKIPHIGIGIITADCVPVLFYDPENHIIGAAHAGWKGALSGVVQNTIETMELLGADRKNIIAVLGPCIHQKSYEVDEQFHALFMEKGFVYGEFFIPGSPHHFQFDLPGFVKKNLSMAGIQTIGQVDYDTYEHKDLFFSCRRAFHENTKFGCQISVISLG